MLVLQIKIILLWGYGLEKKVVVGGEVFADMSHQRSGFRLYKYYKGSGSLKKTVKFGNLSQ